MSEIPAAGRNVGGRSGRGVVVTDDAVSAWFIREILPLEASLMNYLRHNWRNASDFVDLRQEVYVRVLQAAREHIPDNAHRFLLTCARNLLIDLVRRARVVPIEAVADLEGLGVAADAPEPDRWIMAREEVRRLQAVLGRLPARAREAVTLAYFDGLSGKEVAERMGVTQAAASQHLAKGVLMLTDILYGAPADRSTKS
jgi:RNA polymerase sigma factor (sigma-70 family)